MDNVIHHKLSDKDHQDQNKTVVGDKQEGNLLKSHSKYPLYSPEKIMWNLQRPRHISSNKINKTSSLKPDTLHNNSHQWGEAFSAACATDAGDSMISTSPPGLLTQATSWQYKLSVNAKIKTFNLWGSLRKSSTTINNPLPTIKCKFSLNIFV